MPLTNYYGSKVVDHINGVATLVPPANIYFGLSTTAPTLAGTNVSEPSSVNAYARVLKVNTSSTWNAATNAAAKTKVAVAFPTCTTADWGTCSYILIWDALTGGNLLEYALLATPAVITIGVTYTLALGDYELVFT